MRRKERRRVEKEEGEKGKEKESHLSLSEHQAQDRYMESHQIKKVNNQGNM
jgi:hypothetical protein